MKVKVYKVSLKEDPNIWYFVDAPSKRIAKWCGQLVTIMSTWALVLIKI